MESQEVLESKMVLHNTDGEDDLNVGSLCNNGFESKEMGCCVRHSDSMNVDLLEDLDTMMEDIDNRLRVSRMVSDSVIKGMVNAVVQEADERIKAKDLELSSLKLSLDVNRDAKESSWFQETRFEPGTIGFKGSASDEDDLVTFDETKESFLVLRKSALEQLTKLKEQIRAAGSCNELVSFGGVSDEGECESLESIDKTVDSLEGMVKTMCRRVDNMLVFSEPQREQELKSELEAMVMQSAIREKFEEELRDHNASLCVGQYIVWAEKLKEISGLRNELDALKRFLPSSESGSLLSHGSFDADSSQKPLSSQLSLLWEENRMSVVSKTDVPETFDATQLKHMTRQDMVKFFNNRISIIKREHESVVQRTTEKYISLKGKYLAERRSVVPHGKDFEMLRKKINEVIPKLDKILVEGDKFPESGNDGKSLDGLVDKLDTLMSENRKLRDALSDKKTEVERLSSQQHVSSEANVQKLRKIFDLSLTDAHIESSITEDVYKCVIGYLGGNIKSMKEESETEVTAMQEIYEVLLREAKCELQDSDVELSFMQGLSRTIFGETFKDAKEKFMSLFNEHQSTVENLSSLEKKVVKREAETLSERSRNEARVLRKVMEEKENIERELTKVREQFELASDELNNLRKQASWQETLMSKANKELDEISGNLLKAQEQIEVDKLEITSLNQKLKLAMEEIKAVDDLRNRALAVTQEKDRFVSSVEAKERDHKKQMEAIVVLIDGFSTMLTDFECRVAGDVRRYNTRLENISLQLCSLVKAANVLKRRGLLYKQKLERKCCDLQMAEDEVDLLGDEVETLLSLLEKIYVALDHYSTVLQYYPGVIEILKLVRRELSVESVKGH